MTPTLMLEDIVLPEAIGLWPLAWGWWAVLVIALIVLGVMVRALHRYIGYRRLVRSALNELQQLPTQYPPEKHLQALNDWLKRQCRNRFRHAQSLYGTAWVEFLNQSAKQTLFDETLSQALIVGIYQSTQLSEAQQIKLWRASERWLKQSKALAKTQGATS